VEEMEYILNFSDVDKNSLGRVGGKNASLGEMIRSSIPVPPGFAVTTDTYLSFITETNIKDRISDILSTMPPDDVESLNKASAEIQGIIGNASLSEGIKSAIREGYSLLCERCSAEAVPVAVRSSATAEDLPTASFAGQQDTYLWVQGTEKVLETIQRCWASLFTPRAIGYRIKNDFPHEKVLISVGVQKMVNAKTAGVMFTVNPTNGDVSKVVIEGSWGLGETVVGGTVNPDKFVVDKVIMEINERTISAKHIQCVYDSDKGGVVDIEVEPDRRSQCCLEDKEIIELARLGKQIEKHYGCSMDIEWAIDQDFSFPQSVFIVQARPETIWSQRKREPVIGSKNGHTLLMEQAMKRIRIHE
jgi:pyruvate,water dikinase